MRSIIFGLLVALQTIAIWTSPTTSGLMHASNFTLVGYARTKTSNIDDAPANCYFCFQDALNGAFTYWPAHHSVLGTNQYRGIVEESIPAPVNSSTLFDLNMSTVLQKVDQPTGFSTDLSGNTPAHQGLICGETYYQSGCGWGGFFIRPSDIIGSGFTDYDNSNQRLNFYTFPQILANSGAAGAFQVGTVAFGGVTGRIASKMIIPIPAAYQASFGGADMMVTGGPLSVTYSACLGPCITVLHSADVGVTLPPTSTLVLGYSESHDTLGPWAAPGREGFGVTDTLVGAAWIPGTKSIIIAGTRGTIGNASYGPPLESQGGTYNGTNAFPPNYCDVWAIVNPNVPGDSNRPPTVCNEVPPIPPNTPDSTPWIANAPCYPLACVYESGIDPHPSFKWGEDPCNGSEGPHSYPYISQFWVYNVDDLIAVYNGTKNYYDPVPYEYWTLQSLNGGTLPAYGAFSGTSCQSVYGMTLDTTDNWLLLFENAHNPIMDYFSYTMPSAPVPLPLQGLLLGLSVTAMGWPRRSSKITR
jgi:hypothetical protein